MFSDASGAASKDRLAARIASRTPRLVSVWAPAGYEKRAFIDAYGARFGRLISCDLDPRRDRDLARAVLGAIVAGDRSRAARSAADRLAERRDHPFGTAREALRREWPSTDGRELLLLRDATGALSSPAGVDLITELLATLPAERTIALSTRTPLPPALAQLFEGQRTEGVDPTDLALSLDDAREAARVLGVTECVADAIHALTEGWPLVTRLLLALVEPDDTGVFLSTVAELPRHALLAFASQRIVAALDERTRDAVVAATVRPGATAGELVRVLGARCDDAVLFRLRRLPFVSGDAERVFVHPEISALLRSRFSSLVDRLYEQTLHALAEDGAHGAAASVALENGEPERAAALLDAAPSYAPGTLALGDYERVLDQIDRDIVTRYPNVWMATIAFRRFSVDCETYVREAETVYYCLPYSAAPDKRVVALMHLASAYFNLGRVAECDALIQAALEGFAAEPSAVRASVLNFSAALRGEQGRFAEARGLAREGGAWSREGFTENLTLHHIDAMEAVARGHYDRVRVIFDELLRRHSRDELPLYYAYAATDGAFWAWAFGDEASFARYLSLLEDALTPGLEAGFARMIEAAHGRAIVGDDQYAWPVHIAIAQLYRLGRADDRAEAVSAARAAAKAADERGDPMLQVLAHTALHVLDEEARPAARATLSAIAQQVESPELAAAVRDVIAGRGFGFLEPFVKRRVVRARDERAPKLTVELIAGRISRDGASVKVSGKELELLALLASTAGTLTRDRIGEALWDHLDAEEWPNNLKVTLSRLRAKLSVRDAITFTDGNYRLSRSVDVDVRRYEAVVRETAAGDFDDARRASLRAILDAYAGGTVARYEHFAWMQPVVARINDLVCTAGLALARDALAAGRSDDARRYARAVIDVDQHNEEACETMMEICLQRNDADAARREYRRYAAGLAAELGAEPSPRLRELLAAAR